MCFSGWGGVASQIVLLPRNYSLYFKALVYEDTGMYICLVNDRHSPEKVIDLLVHGKRSEPIETCEEKEERKKGRKEIK